MGKRLKKLRKIRLHHEGYHTLVYTGAALLALNIGLHITTVALTGSFIAFYVVLALSIAGFAVLVNFFRCPIRLYEDDTRGLVVAPADGRVVVVEETDENEYLHERRVMVSIFMSLFNVHANWMPVDGQCKYVRHHAGNFHAAWLPKASIENERSTVVITTPEGTDILVRQIAGACARRIVTYPQVGEDCYIDDHMGFIKFGSRVDLYLPLGTKVQVKPGDRTVGNETVIAKLGS